LIWVAGEIVPDGSLRISALDRTFEHGLGLFETFRTWNGRACLLDRHLKRLERSAVALGLPLSPAQLPDETAVCRLLETYGDSLAGRGADARLRLTLTGGVISDGARPSSTLWMAAGPLPLNPIPGAVVTHAITVAADDPLARHKTLNYWGKRLAHEDAVKQGSDDVLVMTVDGLVHESSRSNLFLVESNRLITPELGGPVLPGITRQIVLERAIALGVETAEEPVTLERLVQASEAFLTNSVRGILPLARLMGRTLPAPGLLTSRLDRAFHEWLDFEEKPV
jgi:branched-subunit amino acid aminotransferase/4-amino-4-deoxychorismate lyase